MRLRNIIVCVLQVGCPLKACCFSTRTLWARWCLGATPRRQTSPRLMSATTLGSAWAAGACASSHLVLLSTQVSNPVHENTTMVNFQLLLSGNVCVFLSHPREAGGTLLSALSVFLRLPGIRLGHGSGHALHQPVRGAVSLCYLWSPVLLALHAALFTAL